MTTSSIFEGSPENRAKILELYKSGKSQREIAKTMNVSVHTISRQLRKIPSYNRRMPGSTIEQKLSAEQIQSLAKEWTTTKSQSATADKFGVNVNTARKFLLDRKMVKEVTGGPGRNRSKKSYNFDQIMQSYANGVSQHIIAAEYGVSSARISQIITDKKKDYPALVSLRKQRSKMRGKSIKFGRKAVTKKAAAKKPVTKMVRTGKAIQADKSLWGKPVSDDLNRLIKYLQSYLADHTVLAKRERGTYALGIKNTLKRFQKVTPSARKAAAKSPAKKPNRLKDLGGKFAHLGRLHTAIDSKLLLKSKNVSVKDLAWKYRVPTKVMQKRLNQISG